MSTGRSGVDGSECLKGLETGLWIIVNEVNGLIQILWNLFIKDTKLKTPLY